MIPYKIVRSRRKTAAIHITYDDLINQDIDVTAEQQRRIREKINSVLTYEPRIGIFSKSGVGKSSLCNALFGRDICPIDDVEACTRKPQEVLLDMGGKGIKLIDVPGVGESNKTNKEYAKLYASLLPELDLILWLLKADERAYSIDETIYKDIIKPHINAGKPIFFVLNQCEKIEPSDEWDYENNRPGATQFENLARKAAVVSRFFNVAESLIIPISSKMKYNLSRLVDEIVFALPNEKKITFLRSITEENRSDESICEVKRAWYEILGEVIISVAKIGKDVIFKMLDNSKNRLERFLDKIFGWIG